MADVVLMLPGDGAVAFTHA